MWVYLTNLLNCKTYGLHYVGICIYIQICYHAFKTNKLSPCLSQTGLWRESKGQPEPGWGYRHILYLSYFILLTEFWNFYFVHYRLLNICMFFTILCIITIYSNAHYLVSNPIRPNFDSMVGTFISLMCSTIMQQPLPCSLQPMFF